MPMIPRVWYSPRSGRHRGQAVSIKCRRGSKGCSSPPNNRDIANTFMHSSKRLDSSVVVYHISFLGSSIFGSLCTSFDRRDSCSQTKSNQRSYTSRRTDILSMIFINSDIMFFIHEVGSCEIPRCKPYGCFYFSMQSK